IDVHDRFPGFLADPQDVFEALWARRTTANVAGLEVPCCDVLGSAAILALHALRDPSRPHLQAELAHLVDELDRRLDDVGRAELAQLAAATRSSATLEPFLDAVGAPRTGREVVDGPELKAWRIRTAATGVKSVAWVAELSRTPLRRWIPTLWRAVTLTEAEIRHTYPEAAPGSWGLFRARIRRLRRGLVALPKAARIVWRSGVTSRPAGGRP
ncbi:MAG: hypothetical protein ACRDPJ_14945, partial [Nocardioidaceae bacterium]